ncbi:hypothetical protein [Sphingomonas daechungensis]|uniref:hypothetical protein n=1 Tax=Sphingomonas daechungensis TaxID=1176646 RepID=UPI0037846A06
MMAVILALRAFARLIPWQAWALAGVLAFAGVWHWKEVRAAVAASYAALVKKSDEQGAAADAGSITVNECYAKGEPWRWNREMRRCEKP